MSNKPPSEKELSIRGLIPEDVWDYENGFHWFSDVARLGKMMAHYELYKKVVELPGDILELGVYKGCSLIRFATFRSMLENDASRKIVGFDAFGKFPVQNMQDKEDFEFVEKFESTGGYGLQESQLKEILSNKGFTNIELNAGDVFDTLPEYIAANPHTRIAILHLDMDVKEPTTLALEMLYDRVVKHGLIILDDYNVVSGETDAVDAFFKDKNEHIQKLPYSNVPGFVIKT